MSSDGMSARADELTGGPVAHKAGGVAVGLGTRDGAVLGAQGSSVASAAPRGAAASVEPRDTTARTSGRGGASVLIVGSGGREHALAAAVRRSPLVDRLAFAGGANAGLEAIATRVDADRVEEEALGRNLVVIGPEAPLVDGLADRLRSVGVAVFGPSAAAARLEASKSYTKSMCAEVGIPTAAATLAGSLHEGLAAVRRMGAPVVVKADGLAAGKGVVVAQTLAEAERAVSVCFDGAFGGAGAQVVVEERLEGPEVSLFVLCDGHTARPLASARDYKRAFDGNTGPNTGGMGAVCPAPGFSMEAREAAMERIVRPTLGWLAERANPYVGVLYAGLMLTRDGPKLIEYNVRFGDPECQVIWPLVRSDPFVLLHATATGRLADAPIELSPRSAVGVVVAADGYPGVVHTGDAIGGLALVEAAGATIYHAATRYEGPDIVSDGGRVLTAVATGDDVADARQRVYGALAHLSWPTGRMRSDIAA